MESSFDEKSVSMLKISFMSSSAELQETKNIIQKFSAQT